MATSDVLRDKIDQVHEKLQASNTDLRDRLETRSNELKSSIEENKRAVAKLEATLGTAKLIGIVGAIVLAILGALGTYEFLRDRQTLKTLVEDTKAVTRENALLTQGALIDALESEFGKEASLDALRGNQAVRNQIKSLSTRIQALAKRLEASDRSTYYHVGEALEPYLQHRCQDVITMLDKVKVNERDRFIYAYMRGACLLDVGPTQEAGQWLATARALSGGMRANMSANLEAAAKLYLWKATKNGSYIDEAIQILTSTIERDPAFAPAYTNLACAYAAKGDYALVTKWLVRPTVLKLRTSDDIVGHVKDDLVRPSDRFLTDYVVVHLKIRTPLDNPGWAPALKSALRI